MVAPAHQSDVADDRANESQAFIDARYKNGKSLTDDEITGMLIAVLFAGQHTSSITSTWTGLYMLAYKSMVMPGALDEQRKVRLMLVIRRLCECGSGLRAAPGCKHVRPIAARGGGGGQVMKEHGDELNFDILSEMDHLHCCVKEALRLHPPLIMLMRYCHKAFTVC
jgi:sterol 14-demethylase